MAREIRTKRELFVDFKDNSAGEITAEKMRNFVLSNLVREVEEAKESPHAVSRFADQVVVSGQGSVINLPSAAEYGDRALKVINLKGGAITITAQPGDTINTNQAAVMVPGGNTVYLDTELGGRNWITEVTINARALITNANDFVLVNAEGTGLTFANAAQVRALLGI